MYIVVREFLDGGNQCLIGLRHDHHTAMRFGIRHRAWIATPCEQLVNQGTISTVQISAVALFVYT